MRDNVVDNFCLRSVEPFSAEQPATKQRDSDAALAPVGWTHGDFQHRNLLWVAGRVVAVLDWDKLRVRTLGEEIARTATLQFGAEQGWLDLAKVSEFTAGYREMVPIGDEGLADAVYRLWWRRLTDFWQLGFHHNRRDHSCDTPPGRLEPRDHGTQRIGAADVEGIERSTRYFAATDAEIGGVFSREAPRRSSRRPRRDAPDSAAPATTTAGTARGAGYRAKWLR